MRAIFLDRDGVINVNRDDHVKSWEEFTFLPGALTAIRWLRGTGFRVFVVTNQGVISHGGASHSAIAEIHRQMRVQVQLLGGEIDDIVYCPHASHEQCYCRKPAPGMLLDLASRWQIECERSYIIGDALTDIAAGAAVGCTALMVRTGRGCDQLGLPEAAHHPIAHVAPDLLGAVLWIYQREGLVHPSLRNNTRHRQVAPRVPIARVVGS